MTQFTLYKRTPYFLNIVAGPIVAYISVMFNIVIFFFLFDESVQAPSTVLMQGLALADTLTSLSTYGFEPIFSFFYEQIGTADATNYIELIVYKKNQGKSMFENFTVNEAKELVELPFPYCTFHFVLTQLADTFHHVSMLLTFFLGLQRILAIAFPYWSREQITIRRAAVTCFLCFVISVLITVPKMCVIKIHEDSNGKCLISPPNNILERYEFSYHPVLVTTFLACSVVGIIISTCFIIVTLCCRRRIQGHCSVKEKKSCVLTLSIMIVFLVTDIPRIYLHASLFHTFRSDLDHEEDVAWSKVQTEIDKKYTACYKEVERGVTHSMISEPLLCKPGTYNIPESIHTGIVKWANNLESIIKTFYGDQLKIMLKGPYADNVDKIMKKLSLAVKINIQKSYQVVYNTIACYNKTDLWYQGIFESLVICDERAIEEPFKEHLPFLLLGSTPYSEPFNDMLNGIWTNLNIKIENFKLLIEILKLSTILGCASNFIIYIAMSEKLRQTLKRKLFRISVIENMWAK